MSKHVRWEPSEVKERITHEFAEAMSELDELEAAIVNQLHTLYELSA